MSTITLQGMAFYAHHGCFQDERTIGTRFVVNLSMTVDTSAAERTDDLDATVNYADVYKVVKREMCQPARLLENVAYRIANAVRTDFPTVQNVSVTVSKLNPPIGGQVESASVQVSL